MRLYAIAAVPLLVIAQASGCETVTPPISDYCARYERTVLSRTDLEAIRAIPLPELRKRIQGNDLDYLCNCRGWKDRACRAVRK